MPNPLPTDGPRPRLTKAEVDDLMAEVFMAVNMAPLTAPAVITSAYRKGVPLLTLSRWFGVPVATMRDFVNIQLMGAGELAKVKRAMARPIVGAKTAATRHHPLHPDHPDNH